MSRMDRRDNRIAMRIDLAHIVMTTLFFSLVIGYSLLGLNENTMNIFLVLIIMVGSILGYFTTVTAGILYSIIFIFSYASYNIFLNITKGIPVSGQVYFWMSTVLLFTTSYAYYGSLIRNIQYQNINLRRDNAELVVMDKETGLLSSQTFFNELQAYMKISDRYHIEVYLMLIKIKYENEVIRILGESKYKKIIYEISNVINSMLRDEDRKYILRDANMFGLILLSNKDGGTLIQKRIKEMISSIEFKDDVAISKIKLEVLVGFATYSSEEIRSPYEFFKMAERDLEFDV